MSDRPSDTCPALEARLLDSNPGALLLHAEPNSHASGAIREILFVSTAFSMQV